jgi:hypothetical protein
VGSVVAALALAVPAAGCGAKTGVGVSPPPVDSGVDMPVDFGVDLGSVDAGGDLGSPCVPLPIVPDGGITSVEVAFAARTSDADVLFLVDVTGSMGGVIAGLQNELRARLVPALREAIPQVRIGVASFADFPVLPYGNEGDFPYRTLQPITSDIGAVERAIGRLFAMGGGDEPEAQAEALYQAVTGVGIRTRTGMPPRVYVAPASCPEGSFGHPCFRPGVLPLIFLFTDATSHNGPGWLDPYDPRLLDVVPATYDRAVEALNARNVKVVTFWSSDRDVPPSIERLGLDTETVDARGRPLVFPIGASGASLVRQVLEALGRVGDGLPIDIDVALSDPVDDDIDAVALVSAIVPLRAEPMSGIDGVDFARGRFLGVRGSTRVVFRLDFRTDRVMPMARPQRVLLDVTFRADGRTPLRTERLRLEIPGVDGYDECADGGR